MDSGGDCEDGRAERRLGRHPKLTFNSGRWSLGSRKGGGYSEPRGPLIEEGFPPHSNCVPNRRSGRGDLELTSAPLQPGQAPTATLTRMESFQTSPTLTARLQVIETDVMAGAAQPQGRALHPRCHLLSLRTELLGTTSRALTNGTSGQKSSRVTAVWTSQDITSLDDRARLQGRCQRVSSLLHTFLRKSFPRISMVVTAQEVHSTGAGGTQVQRGVRAVSPVHTAPSSGGREADRDLSVGKTEIT